MGKLQLKRILELPLVSLAFQIRHPGDSGSLGKPGGTALGAPVQLCLLLGTGT